MYRLFFSRLNKVILEGFQLKKKKKKVFPLILRLVEPLAHVAACSRNANL